MQLRLTNKPTEKGRLIQVLQEYAARHGLSPKVLQATELALEEHLTNIMNYGYESDPASHDIVVRWQVTDKHLQIEVEDDGKEFDPLTQPAYDISVPLSQRRVGGLGIHLIRSFMDELDYRRTDGRNVLLMRKRLTEPTS